VLFEQIGDLPAFAATHDDHIKAKLFYKIQCNQDLLSGVCVNIELLRFIEKILLLQQI
jgi:hypothetical protein